MSAPLANALRYAARGLAIAGAFALLVGLRVSYESSAELDQGLAAQQAGDVDGAIAHYRRAARWYLPLSPYPPRALEALAKIARQAEHDKDAALALRGWRSVHASIRAVRGLSSPFAPQLAVADARIAALLAAEEPPPIDVSRSPREREKAILAALAAPPGPSLPFALLALVGFAGWVSVGFAFGRRAVDADDRLVSPTALRLVGAWALFFAAFCVGLAFA